MSSTPRLGKSGIEYLDLVWNFYSGCWNWSNGICPVGTNCWAMKCTQRFKQHYPNGFEPTFYPDAFLSPLHIQKPSIIGVAFMGDLFGDWNDPKQIICTQEKYGLWLPPKREFVLDGLNDGSLRDVLFHIIAQCPQHTFLFLTKNPEQLVKWSPFPENAWVGASATNQQMLDASMPYLLQIEATVQFVSLEPLLERIDVSRYLRDPNYNDGSWYQDSKGIERWDLGGAPCNPLDWLIIGAQTKPYKPPKPEGVQEIVEAADRAGIPVFLKGNLFKDHSLGELEFRQEVPDGRR